jgi:transcriptional regulator with XRE-family HTH domain
VPTNPTAVSWEEYVRNLGHELHRRRIAAGLSQEALAHRAGMTRSHYQQLEKGIWRPGKPANPSLKTLVGLAQVLETEITDLVGTVGIVQFEF